MRRREARFAALLGLGPLLALAGCRPSVPFAERMFFSREATSALPAAIARAVAKRNTIRDFIARLSFEEAEGEPPTGDPVSRVRSRGRPR